MISRRDFLKLGTATAAAAYASQHARFLLDAFAWAQSDNLKKFVQPLRGVGEIPIAASDGTRTWGSTVATHYSIDIADFQDQLHPDLPNPTRLRGFGQGDVAKFKHLGGIIAAKRDEPVQITFRNNTYLKYPLPVDRSIMGAMDGDDRVDVHLHGGFVPWFSDGGPHAWWDSSGKTGPSFINGLGASLAPNEAEYYYPNQQSARLMWYHDHTFGLTRLNAYAGIASGYVIYDDYELSMVANNNLPGPLDPRTLYLVFQDKSFVSANTPLADPSWYAASPNSQPGDLWYAHVYDTGRYGALGPNPAGLPPDPSCVPEFYGDTMLVNGLVAPFVEVEQREYRLRMLNACQAKFMNPRLLYAQGSTFPASAEANTKAPGPGFIQIGTEGGFLPSPTMLSGPNQPLLLMAPAERADLLVDFRNVPAGSILILYTDAPSPFPGGDPRNDYYPGNSKTPASKPGFTPNTRTLLQFRVKARSGPADAPITLPVPARFTPTDPFLIKQAAGMPTGYTTNAQGFATIRLASGVKVQARVRQLTLNEGFDDFGRLAQFLGTNVPNDPAAKVLDFHKTYDDPLSENPSAGDYEIWEIANLTMDTHPIHFHLVNVQVLWRQKFAAKTYAGMPNYVSAPVGPDANELGWKETVRMNPGDVTSVLMKFDLPVVPFSIPASPRTGGHEYVWHCHILEHEEHDMMRPLVVR
ncbi:MAG TPA: multicopper oxidase domain-containing protein [Anaerolineales bacterium]